MFNLELMHPSKTNPCFLGHSVDDEKSISSIMKEFYTDDDEKESNKF